MVPEGWEKRTLASLADYHNGRAFKPQDWGKEGLPIIRIAQMTNPIAKTDFYSGDDIEAKHKINNGDMLFSWSATLAVMLWNRGPAVLNQHIFKVEGKPGIDSDFLYHLLNNSIDALAEHSHGSTMKHIKKGVLKDFIVPVPSLHEQKKIAAILSSVDDAIQATQAVIDQTRRVKLGLLQQLLTRGIGHTQFKKTEIGEIPETWKVATTGQICTSIVPGRDKPKCFNGDIPWLTISDIDGLRVNESKLGLKVTKQELQRVNGKTVPKDTVLMTCVGTFGTVAVAGRELVMNQQLHGFVCGSEVLPLYLCLVLQTKESEMKRISGQTTIPYLNKAKCESIRVPLPPIIEQNQIVDKIVSIEENINANKKNLDGLSSLKRGLMQDLLTGRVRVKLTEEATT